MCGGNDESAQLAERLLASISFGSYAQAGPGYRIGEMMLGWSGEGVEGKAISSAC